MLRRSGADDAWLERARARELAELERRRAEYLGDRPQVDPSGRTAVIVDDGLATGATMKAALIAIRRLGAAKVVVAIPVAPAEALADIEGEADLVVCLRSESRFRGVGGFYDDFHQLTDEETVGLLREAWSGAVPARRTVCRNAKRRSRRWELAGDLRVPPDPRGIILFAHGSGSSRLSPRNMAVADALNAKGFATLLLDLLTPDEARDRRNVFDIPLLAERVMQAALWISGEPDVADLPLGLFGASTGAGAALLAAAELRGRVAAVVSRGGRPDLAGPMLAEVTAPTLLIVGGDDRPVIELNRKALAALACEKLLRIVPGATHLFEEPGTLEAVTEMAGAWFQQYLAPAAPRLAPEPGAAAPLPLAGAAARGVPNRCPHRRSGLRGGLRPFRIGAGRAAGRGLPRHVGILPGPRRHHPPPDRATRLLHRRRRGRLARRRRRGPLRAAGPISRLAPRRSPASRPGCGATANVDDFVQLPARPQRGRSRATSASASTVSISTT